MMKSISALILAGMLALPVHAGEVEIVNVIFERQSGTWVVNTTLRHNDKGWDHYADAWRIVGEDGKVFATRTLHHPHENEQPFTRSLDDVVIPGDVRVVYVEAHDRLHGWSKQRVRVDFARKKGERYSIRP